MSRACVSCSGSVGGAAHVGDGRVGHKERCAVSLFLFAILFSAACGESGRNDTVLTGFSGVLIFGIVAWVVYRYVRSKT